MAPAGIYERKKTEPNLSFQDKYMVQSFFFGGVVKSI